VTDRDIDRFAGRAFEEWGLFAKGTFREDNKKNCKSRKGSAIDADGVEVDKSWEESSHAASPGSSLAEAVAKARDACKFKYLNAAAVVVYGIPVYIGREG
jgi:separase